jgi:transcriptional regulator with XRE-family HTH domain
MAPLRMLAIRIRAERERQGLTQAQLARRARLSRVYVARLETRRQDPRISVVVRIAKALRVKVGRLLE